jgi:hypothetical protein
MANTSSLVQIQKGNNTQSSNNQRPNYGQPTISSAVDKARGEGTIGGNWRTTGINSTISGKEGPIKLNNHFLLQDFQVPA